MPATASRQRILNAARALAEEGSAFTLADVGARAQVSRATVHRLFGSREALLAELDLEPEPGSRERALQAATDMLRERPLSAISMDEVAEAAGLSRASLYRLFPGKPALLRALVQLHSPLATITRVLTEMGDREPEVVMPALARAVAHHLEGRAGLIRTLLFEVSGVSEGAEETRLMAVRETIAPAAAYIARQMAAGRLRPVHPVLALQAFAGPLALHLITRDLLQRLLGLDEPIEASVDALVGGWLEGYAAPGRGGVSDAR